MIRQALIGAAAGAVGTAALNIATYADMVVRGRAESRVPADLAGVLTDRLGIEFSDDDTDSSTQTEQHRQTGLGALFGYVTGLGVGAAYGVVRPYMRDVLLPFLGLGVALSTMAMSDVPATAFDVTDPTEWSATSWMLDFGFHLAYGFVTVIAYDAFADM